MLKHKIQWQHCSAQVNDGASVMAGKNKVAPSVIKRKQPQAEFVHWRSHFIDLAVLFARENKVNRGYMAELTSLS